MMETEISSINNPIDRFFAYAKERENVRENKERGDEWPWTKDPILKSYKFCNVFREDDKTTRWFREYVRNPLSESPSVFLATVMFRWFNRIEIGEILFRQFDVEGNSGFENYLQYDRVEYLDQLIRSQVPKGPWATGAYLITSPKGYDKLGGICMNIDEFHHGKFMWNYEDIPLHWAELAEFLLENRGLVSLEQVWKWLKQVHFQGTFHSYEVVTDLRHTKLLDQAPDIMTWANMGPGARRGLNRLFNRPLDYHLPSLDAIVEMQFLLKESHKRLWTFELRDIEHTLCEYDKYMRVVEGAGRPRSVYKPPVRRVIL